MHLQEKLEFKKFIILAEMEPPKGTDVSSLVANATNVKGRVDAFVAPEMNNAVMKMSSLGAALLLQSKGFETVMQVCCRDRNRLALQADLLAAQALGIPNVMAVTGEDISYGDHHRARAVNDLDLLELLAAIQTLQSGRDLAGIELQGAPRFLVGASLNVGKSGGALEAELAELDKKMAVGAQFFITSPIFALKVLDQFRKRLGNRPAKIIPTVMLLKSVGMARYIDRHLEQIHIPAGLIERIHKAPDRVRECIMIAAELIAGLKDEGYSGVQISTLGWEDRLPAILAAARA
ncbi:MAG TPA: 5,10-methylenetetrahydrofolate reductase [Desulfobacterales bacterium]|nr:5,10-methylenetetrahydrofolate reductase [Desulfobacterales bacterium]